MLRPVDPLYRNLKPCALASHTTFRGYSALLESLNDAAVDETQAKLIRAKTAQYILLRRLMLFEILQCPDSELRKRPDLLRLFLLSSDELVIEDDLGFHMVLNSLPHGPFLQSFSYLRKQLVSCWATLEKKLFAARLRLFPKEQLERLLTLMLPLAVEKKSLTRMEAAVDLLASLVRKGVRLQSNTFLHRRINDWIADTEYFTSLEMPEVACGKRKRAPAKLWFSLSGLPQNVLRAINSHEMQRGRSFGITGEWTAAKRRLFVDFDHGSVLGGVQMLREVSNALFVAFVMPRRAVGCSCPPHVLNGSVECEACCKAVSEGWNARKKSVEAGYQFSRSFIDALSKTMPERYAAWTKRLLLRYAGIPIAVKTAIGARPPEFFPPCIREEARASESSDAVDLFQAVIQRDVEGISTKALRAEAKAQREHGMHSAFGASSAKSAWSCAGMCANDLCPVRKENDAFEIDVAYTRRCHAQMRAVARRHLQIELEPDSGSRVRGKWQYSRDGFECSSAIETPSDYTLNLLYLEWQKRGGPYW